jgi:hypothetical protein
MQILCCKNIVQRLFIIGFQGNDMSRLLVYGSFYGCEGPLANLESYLEISELEHLSSGLLSNLIFLVGVSGLIIIIN